MAQFGTKASLRITEKRGEDAIAPIVHSLHLFNKLEPSLLAEYLIINRFTSCASTCIRAIAS
ncbi:MAG: hypothetical protein AB1589_05210 [Cyanobacteriota bacterium]